jgi:hypothetical protein
VIRESSRSGRYSGSAIANEVELWTEDSTKIERMLFAGSNLDKARALFEREIKRRPRIRLTIRQRTRVLDAWPPNP